MVDVPGRAPDPEELGLREAAQCVVTEMFARLDRADVEGVVELYAEDGRLEGAEGRSAIRQSILRSAGALNGTPTAHVVTNLRASVVDDGVVVEYIVVGYTVGGPGPYAANVILNQRQTQKRSADGILRIVEHRVLGYDLSSG